MGYRFVKSGWALPCLALLGAAAPANHQTAYRLINAPMVDPKSAAEVTARCDAALAAASRIKDDLESSLGAATISNSFQPYDDLMALINEVTNEQYLVSQANPAKEIRAAAEACLQRMADFTTAVQLSRPVYDRLMKIPIRGQDEDTRWVLGRQLLQYRLAGVDRDPQTRGKIAALQTRIAATGLKFDGNIRDSFPDIAFEPQDLQGLPADFLAGQPRDAAGKIHIKSESDIFTVMAFADKEETRRKVYTSFINRAWPENGPVLRELLQERAELARLVGYSSFAALALADKMIGTPQKAAAFLDDVDRAAVPGATADYAELLARWRRIDPSATDVKRWNADYVGRLLQKERYDVDAEQVRGYFSYEKVRSGIFGLMHDLFGAQIKPWDTPVWDKSVTAWELYDGKRLVGRFYIDPHPRDGKYAHAADFPIRIGVEGNAIPLAALVVNFPAKGGMDHYDVSVFLHEFGHLIHSLYSGHHRWASGAMDNLERDFIEAPSQFLEEWVWDYDTLATFTADGQGHPIPRDLVAKMNRARQFEQGIDAKGQILLSEISLGLYDVVPSEVDFDTLVRLKQERYSVYPYVPGTHLWAGFDHLNNYSASYYTYVWSKAIALDLFTRFQKAGLHDRNTAMAYRRLVLEPGATRPAQRLVTDFLGRPFNLGAYKSRLSGK